MHIFPKRNKIGRKFASGGRGAITLSKSELNKFQFFHFFPFFFFLTFFSFFSNFSLTFSKLFLNSTFFQLFTDFFPIFFPIFFHFFLTFFNYLKKHPIFPTFFNFLIKFFSSMFSKQFQCCWYFFQTFQRCYETPKIDWRQSYCDVGAVSHTCDVLSQQKSILHIYTGSGTPVVIVTVNRELFG